MGLCHCVQSYLDLPDFTSQVMSIEVLGTGYSGSCRDGAAAGAWADNVAEIIQLL